MGQLLHGTATTTHAIRKKIQNAEGSLARLATKYNINPKTVHKWKRRDSVEDQQCGRRPGQGSVLVDVDEAVIVEARRKALLPPDDLYDVLLPQMPALTRSNLHRCLQRHGVSRLTDLLPDGEKTGAKTFKAYEPSFLHIDTATGFLENVLAQYPSKIEKILTDNGMEFSYNPLPEGKKPKDKEHPFAALCKAKQTGHRIYAPEGATLVKHPWTNGMVEAMNKKVKANTNTTKRFHYDNVDQLKTHLYHYLLNYTTT